MQCVCAKYVVYFYYCIIMDLESVNNHYITCIVTSYVMLNGGMQLQIILVYQMM